VRYLELSLVFEVEQKGEYVLALKGNHEHLAEDVALLFAHNSSLAKLRAI